MSDCIVKCMVKWGLCSSSIWWWMVRPNASVTSCLKLSVGLALLCCCIWAWYLFLQDITPFPLRSHGAHLNPAAALVVVVPHWTSPLLEKRRVWPKMHRSMETLTSPCTGLKLDGRSSSSSQRLVKYPCSLYKNWLSPQGSTLARNHILRWRHRWKRMAAPHTKL